MFFFLAALAVVAHAQTPAFVPYLKRAEVKEFITHLTTQYGPSHGPSHGLNRAWVEKTLAQARYSETAEKLNTPSLNPPWQRNWNDYRSRNVSVERVRRGLEFLNTHQATLERAQQQWGVPREVIAAVIGVETLYGRITGRLRALDVLTTLSFDYTRRAALFREELTHYLLWCREQDIDPTVPRGSFAGAMGLAQFMPSSLRVYAVDFDNDGHINLNQSPADAIGSVAAFLAAQGWQRDAPLLLKVEPMVQLVALVDQGIEPKRPWSELHAQGVRVEGGAALPAAMPVLLIDLPSPSMEIEGALDVDWRLGGANLAALLQYNRSYFYAAAVVELAQTLQDAEKYAVIAP